VNKLNLVYGPFDKFLAVKDLTGIKIVSYNNDVEVEGVVRGEISKLKTRYQ